MINESVMERVSIDAPVYLQSEKDWAHVRGKDLPPRKPVRYFVDKRTDRQYLWVLGAFAAPGLNTAGFGVVVGIDRFNHLEHGKRLIRVLEEIEESTIHGLMRECVRLHKKYAAFPVMDRLWFAEMNKAWEDRAFAALKKLGTELYEFCPQPGCYVDFKADKWSAYLTLLNQYVQDLYRYDAPKLRAYMKAGPQDQREVKAFKPEFNPALAAISVAVAELIINRPWFYDVDGSAFHLED